MKDKFCLLVLLMGLLTNATVFAQSAASSDASKSVAPNSAQEHQHHRHEAHDAAIGNAGKAAKVARTVHIEMTDNMRFSPASVAVKQGETIRFVVKNSGQLKHEFVLGAPDQLKAHNEAMKSSPEMQHSDPNMVTVDAGKTGEVIGHFTQPGVVNFACLQLGHFDAGMAGQVMVQAKSNK